MKEERVKRKSEGSSRRIEEQRNAEKEKALQLSKIFEEQDIEDVDNGRNLIFGEDDNDDLQKSLQRARKLALSKQDQAAISVPQAIALLAASTTSSSQNVGNQNPIYGESQESKIVVFTEMKEFAWGLQLDYESHKPDNTGDVFIYEDQAPKASSDQERKDEPPVHENKEEMVGKGLSGALQLLKERGALKEGGIELGGRNIDKKNSKFAKEIRIERRDEFGRIMTPKEEFRMISHKFHGKGPGKMKQEKRMKQYQEELKLKQIMENSEMQLLSVARMREAQARLKTPYLVLSDHPATVEKGSQTPLMLGNRNVEHFLGIKRKAEPSNMDHPRNQKPQVG